MPYTINLSNGSVLTVIPDDTLDNSTSLTLLGRSFVGYGEIIAEDFVHVLENFANFAPPSAPLAGQLWYNTDSGVLSVYTGSLWEAVGGTSTGITIEHTTNSGGGLTLYNPEAPTNSRYYRIRLRDDGQYAGHLVIESLNDNNTVKTVVFDTDSFGNIMLKALNVLSITSNGITLQETTSSNTGLTFYDSLAPSNSRLYRIRMRDDAPYSGHLVIEALNDIGTLKGVVFDLDSAGNNVLSNLTVTGSAVGVTLPASDNSTKFATTAFVKSNTRNVLRTNLYVYVSPTSGNDNNSGLDPGAAFRTIQRAWDLLALTYDGGGYQAYINLADGTYDRGLYTVYPMVGFQAVNVVGNNTTPSNVFINVVNSPGLSFSLPGVPAAYISGVKIAASGTAGPSTLADQGYGIVARDIMLVDFKNVEFGACSIDHMWAGRGGCINISGPYKISGGAQIHYACGNGGIIFASNINTVTLIGTPAFSAAFAYPNIFGNLQIAGTTFSGTATGTKYIIGVLSSLNTGGIGASHLPGTPGTGSIFGGGQLS